MFVAFKLMSADYVEIPIVVSLAVILGVLLVTILASVISNRLVSGKKEFGQ